MFKRILVMSLLAAASPLAQGKPVTVADFAGTWNIEFMSHQLALVIEPGQGNEATATMMVMGRDIPLKGELVDRTITFTGVTLLPESDLRRQMRLDEGDVFSRTKLRESVRAIADLYGAIGRASAEVVPRTATAGDRIQVFIEVTEGPEVYIERINITGNTRSEDKILRRELPMVEGDRFLLRQLRRARQRLVMDAAGDLLQTDIHALTITARAPGEA